jgi:hypothetical protein
VVDGQLRFSRLEWAREGGNGAGGGRTDRARVYRYEVRLPIVGAGEAHVTRQRIERGDESLVSLGCDSASTRCRIWMRNELTSTAPTPVISRVATSSSANVKPLRVGGSRRDARSS